MHSPILQPVVVLAGWTLIVLFWMIVRRFPAMKALGVDLAKARGSRGGELEGRVAPEVMWPSHNYSHLLEQPTLFYAVALTLAVAGAGGGTNAMLAWAYVGFRIAHSLWQVNVNVVRIRLALFALSTLALIALIVEAALVVF